MTKKVLEINACGLHYKGYYEEGKVNPWRLYRVYWDRGEHRKMVDKFANFVSMILAVNDNVYRCLDAWKD